MGERRERGADRAHFGEAAPLNGVYASGRTGFYEHNLYPLRYNRAVAEITKPVSGETIMWARSAWAGSQRYPLHWGGDAKARGLVCLPSDNVLHEVALDAGGKFLPPGDPFAGRVKWTLAGPDRG